MSFSFGKSPAPAAPLSFGSNPSPAPATGFSFGVAPAPAAPQTSAFTGFGTAAAPAPAPTTPAFGGGASAFGTGAAGGFNFGSSTAATQQQQHQVTLCLYLVLELMGIITPSMCSVMSSSSMVSRVDIIPPALQMTAFRYLSTLPYSPWQLRAATAITNTFSTKYLVICTLFSAKDELTVVQSVLVRNSLL